MNGLRGTGWRGTGWRGIRIASLCACAIALGISGATGWAADHRAPGADSPVRAPGSTPQAGIASPRATAPASQAPASAGQASGGPPLKINLDEFDALKKLVLLPNGEHLAYVEMGDPHGAPVVLIHGYTDNARDWVPLIPYLSKKFRLIALDIRGHGRSDKPECCYARIDFAYDIKLLLDSLHIERADVVGHSLGSLITQALAEQWPERVRKVVLISSTGGPRAGSPPRKPAFDYAAEIRKLQEPIDPNSPFMIAWWASPRPVNEEFIRRQRRDAAQIPLPVWLAVLEQGAGFTDLQLGLPKLRAPALLIWGSDDPIMGEEGRQTLREALPTAQVKVFKGLGHNPFWEEPAEVAQVIDRFLAD